MGISSLAGVMPRLRSVALGTHSALSDADLLDWFIADRDETAFEVIVRRHGPMVYAVCRRVLRHTQDAEDAFQATFLVLAHKARAVSPRNKLAGWLHGVAHKTALKARHRAARRVEVEKLVPARGPEEMCFDKNWNEAESLLDQELAGLADRYRLPIILCDLEGRTRTAAAAALGCSEGTLSSRLTRGRRLLAERLKRRGVHLSGAAIALAFEGSSTALAEPLIRATIPAALSSVAAPAGAAFLATSRVAHLAKGVMKNMFLKKLQTIAVAALALAVVALVGLAVGRSQAALAAPPPPAARDVQAVELALADVEGRLLMNRKVLRELKFDFDQFDRVMDLLEDASKKASQKMNEQMDQVLPNLAGRPNPGMIQQMIRDAQEEGEKTYQKVADGVMMSILSPAQRKRLREIDLQARGHEAFTLPAVAKVLELTLKQKEQLEANEKQVAEEIDQVLQKPIPGRGAVNRNAGPNGVVMGGFSGPIDYEGLTRDARAAGMKRALAVLTDEQKAAWKKYTGEPFPHPIASRKWSLSGFGHSRMGVPPVPPPPNGAPGGKGNQGG